MQDSRLRDIVAYLLMIPNEANWIVLLSMLISAAYGKKPRKRHLIMGVMPGKLGVRKVEALARTKMS